MSDIDDEFSPTFDIGLPAGSPFRPRNAIRRDGGGRVARTAFGLHERNTMIAGTQLWGLSQSERALVERLMAQAPQTRAVAEPQGRYPLIKGANGVAVVSVQGLLIKTRGWIHEYLGNHSTSEIEMAVRAAKDDPAVSSIVLRIESPGGQVSGVYEAGEAIRAAAAVKPVTAYIEDVGASGAYWLASQANRIVANAPAVVGSIGTYLVVFDLSVMAQREGITVHVVKAGEHKGTGVPGTTVTPAQLAELQRNVDAINELFVAAVARGRRMSLTQAKSLADGRVHLAAQAKALGMIDAVCTWQEALSGSPADAAKGHAQAAAGAGETNDLCEYLQTSATPNSTTKTSTRTSGPRWRPAWRRSARPSRARRWKKQENKSSPPTRLWRSNGGPKSPAGELFGPGERRAGHLILNALEIFSWRHSSRQWRKSTQKNAPRICDFTASW